MIDNFTPSICVVGLGYVGLPLLVEFAKNGVEVFGFDVNSKKIEDLKNGIDPCNQIDCDTLKSLDVKFSDNPEIISKSNFVIIAVPTPIDKDHKPDLQYVKSATELVAKYLNHGSFVVYESTVYPGVTEDICLPILEKISGLNGVKDFYIGYSPERVNPGDEEHTIDKIVKIVSGMDSYSTEIIANVYSVAIKAGVFKAKNIKTAEAAKVIENIQRDLNIALMNDLAQIFDRLGIKTDDVIAAASTKWNFHRYHAGLVGGHCIGVDPYYLLFKAQEVGYEPHVLLAGRKVNESMAKYLVDKLIKLMIKADKKVKGGRVLIMGLTFKEDINDIRNSKALDIVNLLKDYGVEVVGFEPHVSNEEVLHEFGIKNEKWQEIKNLDAVILFNKHKLFSDITLLDLKDKMDGVPVLFDVKNFYKDTELESLGFVSTSL